MFSQPFQRWAEVIKTLPPVDPENYHGLRTDVDLAKLQKLLLNGWSAEYALGISWVDDVANWTIPQAYYSTLFTSRAMLMCHGIHSAFENEVSKQIGKLVYSRNFYPAPLAFYTLTYPEGELRRMQGVEFLSDLLIDTRQMRYAERVDERQQNPHRAFRDYSTGEVLTTLRKEHNQLIGRELGLTTWYSLLQRLRISSKNKEVSALSNHDAQELHRALIDIVPYVNSVHEASIYAQVGYTTFNDLFRAMPDYLQEGFKNRFDNLTRIHA